jgi:hypothetical protein
LLCTSGGTGTPHSERAPASSNGQVRRAVVLVGLKFGIRISQLHAIAEALERNGFNTRRSLSDLTDVFAEALQIPVCFAAALREDSQVSPAWKKTGPIPHPPRGVEESVLGPSCGVNGVRLCIHSNYASYDGDGKLNDRRPYNFLSDLGGFPTPLRSYPPKHVSSPRRVSRPASPSEPRALETHIMRQESARSSRKQENHETVISSFRREHTPDAWKESTFYHPPQKWSMSGDGERPLEGTALPRAQMELTKEIAMQPPSPRRRASSRSASPSSRSSHRGVKRAVACQPVAVTLQGTPPSAMMFPFSNLAPPPPLSSPMVVP